MIAGLSLAALIDAACIAAYCCLLLFITTYYGRPFLPRYAYMVAGFVF
jgi:hypothetical protein